MKQIKLKNNERDSKSESKINTNKKINRLNTEFSQKLKSSKIMA